MAANSLAKPGDLIEVLREGYQHWAVYIGGDEVVHLTTSMSEKAHNSSAVGNLLMAVDSNKALVRRQKLWEVTDSDRFRVNNLLDDKYEPRERHVIVRDACSMVGQEMPYSLTRQNCEHFVTMLRYGKPQSRQVKRAVEIGVGAVAAGVGIIGAIAAVATAFALSKRKDDDDGDSSD